MKKRLLNALLVAVVSGLLVLAGTAPLIPPDPSSATTSVNGGK